MQHIDRIGLPVRLKSGEGVTLVEALSSAVYEAEHLTGAVDAPDRER